MSIITIQCRLVAPEASRRYLWELMSELNTPLINQLLIEIPQQEDFEIWRERGKFPAGTVKNLCDNLKSEYIGQPARFYTSAITVVDYIYKAWFQQQKRLQHKLEGQKRWLEILKSDEELVNYSNCSLEIIKNKAKELLAIYPKIQDLFNAYHNTNNLLEITAICYLLKNKGKIRTLPENPEIFAKNYRKAEIKLERLINQIEGRLPKGRDLTGERWLNTLITATSTVPINETEAKQWQNILLTKTKLVPFPINYETNEDCYWSINKQGRLSVRFNGISEHTFQIYCNQRQLKWFQRFYEDQETKKASKNQHSSALFTLRSARIVWQENTGKGEPWNVHHLTLFCSLDTRLWTAEGTEEIRQEKADLIAKTLIKMNEKGNLTKQQEAFITRKESTLAKIKNPFPRPSKILYQGQSNILVGIAMGLEKPATIAIVDSANQKVITYRNLKQLLGENYHLIYRQHQQKKRSSHQRHKNQKLSAPNEFGESNLGEYIDRIIAKAIIQIAQQYQAGSIVIPKLSEIREIIQSEIIAKAEQKIIGSIEAQKNYTKQYRINVHQWSYGRLIDNIKAQASKINIIIEEEKQMIRASPQEQAKLLALNAYNNRNS